MVLVLILPHLIENLVTITLQRHRLREITVLVLDLILLHPIENLVAI